MISKRILVSMIVIISLVQFITCPASTDPAAAKPGGPSKSGARKSGFAFASMESGMNPDDETEIELDKPNGIRQKILRPIKIFFWPVRYVLNKYKSFMNKVQNKNNKDKSATPESDGEKSVDKNKTK